MPWNLMVAGVGLALLVAVWLLRRQRPPSIFGSMPDVGQPPEDAEPMIEPRLQDIGSGSYELPLTDRETDPDRSSD